MTTRHHVAHETKPHVESAFGPSERHTRTSYALAAALVLVGAETVALISACSAGGTPPDTHTGGGGSGSTAKPTSTSGSGTTSTSSQSSGANDASTEAQPSNDSGDEASAPDTSAPDASVATSCALLENQFLAVASNPTETTKLTTANQIGINVQLTDAVFKGLNLSDITVRYWFTADGNALDKLYFDRRYSQNGNGHIEITSQVTGTFHPAPAANTTPTSDTYLEFSMSADAGTMLPNGGTALLAGVVRGPGSGGYSFVFDETNDYSYHAGGSPDGGPGYAPTDGITVYYKGVLAAGCEPH